LMSLHSSLPDIPPSFQVLIPYHLKRPILRLLQIHPPASAAVNRALVPTIGSLDSIRLSSAEAGRKKALADTGLNVNSPTERRSFAKLLDTQKCVPHF